MNEARLWSNGGLILTGYNRNMESDFNQNSNMPKMFPVSDFMDICTTGLWVSRPELITAVILIQVFSDVTKVLCSF
jgi:hypothetical protein